MKFLTLICSRGRRQTRWKTLCLREYHITKDGWLREFLEWHADRSSVSAMAIPTFDCLKKSLDLLASESLWKSVTSIEIEVLRAADLLQLFRRLDELLHPLSIATATKKKIAYSLRLLLRQFFIQHEKFTEPERLRAAYRRTAYQESPPRPLISDLISSGNTGGRPLGAIQHASVADLKRKTKRLLRDDLDAIRIACSLEIKKFETHAAWVSKHRELSLTLTEVALIKHAFLLKGSESNTRLLSISNEKLFAYYCHYVYSRPVKRLPHRDSFTGAERLLKYAEETFGKRIYTRFQHLLYLPYLGDSRLLVACVLILQMRTCWNISSVLSMNIDGIKIRGKDYVIQAFKKKTDDETPVVVVSTQDTEAHWALTFLIARLEELKKFRWVESSENSIWLKGTFYGGGGPSVKFFPGNQILREFQKKYALAPFSYNQVRTQALALIYVESGGVEAARRAAGHVSISTTAHYLDQLLLNRLNSSLNLEFQRRLDSSIRYMSSLPDVGASNDMFLDGKAATAEFFSPIGDGATCTDPASPPVDTWLKHGMCGARHCHQDGGCKNRVIHIDADRIREIAETTLFYEKNWHRLANENLPLFEAVYAPSLLFNFALSGVIDKGPYGYLLRAEMKKW